MNHGPVSTPTPTICLPLTEWNANGISGKVTELLTFLHSNNVNIAAIQETKLTNKTKPLSTPGWAAVRLDRHKNKDGGLLMKETIPFVDNTAAIPQSADPHMEQQGISITIPNRQQLQIHNIYIPPRCSAGHNALTAHLLSNNNNMSLIVGDINAHHSRWGTNTNEDERGEQLADVIDAADYTILNENEATRLLFTIDGPWRTYINFKKADWARCAEACDKYLAEAGKTRTVEQTEKTFRKAVNKASGLLIPAGRIQHFQPSLPATVKSLADERDRKRGLNPADETLNDLNKQIQN